MLSLVKFLLVIIFLKHFLDFKVDVLLIFIYMAGEIVRRSAIDVLVFETADPIQFGRFLPLQEFGKIVFRFTREADDEGGPDSQVRTVCLPLLDAAQGRLLVGRATHGL